MPGRTTYGPRWWPPWGSGRTPSDTRGRTGRSGCSGPIWGGPAAGTCRTTPSAGNSTGSGTCGSGSGTSSRRTPSARKKRAIRRRLRALPPRAAVLAEDETDLRLFPPLRAGWARRGEDAPVPITGGNAKRVLFGAIDLRTGGRGFLARRQGRGADFEEFLDLIRGHHRGRPVVLLVDEDSSHTAEDSRDTAEDLGIELVWLPKRSPHLNPMDHLWRHGKERMSGNYQYPSPEAQAAAFIAYLAGLSRTEALRKAGVLSPRFWLRA